jgi:hypothetical protein
VLKGGQFLDDEVRRLQVEAVARARATGRSTTTFTSAATPSAPLRSMPSSPTSKLGRTSRCTAVRAGAAPEGRRVSRCNSAQGLSARWSTEAIRCRLRRRSWRYAYGSPP